MIDPDGREGCPYRAARALSEAQRIPDFIKQNPKSVRAAKDGKAPMDLIPMDVMKGVARVLAGGADKYGRRNWVVDEILMSTYKGAILRHLTEWFDELVDEDPDDGEHPLDHIIACCYVVRDAIRKGTAIDDRTRCESVDPETGERSYHDLRLTDDS